MKNNASFPVADKVYAVGTPKMSPPCDSARKRKAYLKKDVPVKKARLNAEVVEEEVEEEDML
ncbi:hypothetical protein BDB01DRAFT_188427 [Pilobolus umbonatus]|nr:hypothetical protein BDB01DRAFT_188427 [Pilobolus umbonatus]